MKEQLDKLKDKGYIYRYTIENDNLIISYGLSSVGETERSIDIENKDLKQALFESGEDIRDDIENSLVDDNDFFGYDNKEELEERIEEETLYLKHLSEVVEKSKEEKIREYIMSRNIRYDLVGEDLLDILNDEEEEE